MPSALRTSASGRHGGEDNAVDCGVHRQLVLPAAGDGFGPAEAQASRAGRVPGFQTGAAILQLDRC